MGVRERTPGRWTVSMYDPTLKRKVHVATCRSREAAKRVEAMALARTYVPPRRWPRCPNIAGPVVYFIAAPELRLVKIGYTKGLRQRFGEISRGSPVEIELVHAVPGTRRLEREFHERFEGQWSRGEWFRDEGPFAAFLREHAMYPEALIAPEAPSEAGMRRIGGAA